MNIFNFLKKKRNVEISEEDKIKKDIQSKIYNRKYLYWGNYDRFIDVNGQPIKYSHSECFLVDNQYPSSVKSVIRLTGDNLTGEPIFINDVDYWECGDCSGVSLSFNDGGIEYRLSSSSCLDESWLSNHNISGYELEERTNEGNEYAINYQLNKIAEQQEIDSMFGK